MLLNKKIPFGYIFNKIRNEILLFTVYAFLIYVFKEVYHLWTVSMPLTIPAILGTTIALLLGFRTNQSYDRWWEARKLWGAIVNDSRNLIRQLQGFIDTKRLNETEVDVLYRRVAYRQSGWCHCLGQALRGVEHIVVLERYIPKKEIAQVKMQDNVPNAMLVNHTRDFKRLYELGVINAYQFVELESTVVSLCNAMGACERIKNTVFPRTYSSYIHFFIYLFILILPLGLVDLFGLVEVPIVVAVATAFFLIERTAIYMQDPFENRPTDTNVTEIATKIERNILQMINETDNLPEKTQPEGYYIM